MKCCRRLQTANFTRQEKKPTECFKLAVQQLVSVADKVHMHQRKYGRKALAMYAHSSAQVLPIVCTPHPHMPEPSPPVSRP